MLGDDGVQQTLARFRLLGGNHRTDREGAQSVGHRQRALSRVFAAGERKDVRPALTLAVDVDTANLVDERVDQPADQFGIGAKDADLLTVLGTRSAFPWFE